MLRWEKKTERLYFHPNTAVSWLLIHQIKYKRIKSPDEWAIKKQAYRDESTVSLFFPIATYIYTHTHIYIYIYFFFLFVFVVVVVFFCCFFCFFALNWLFTKMFRVVYFSKNLTFWNFWMKHGIFILQAWKGSCNLEETKTFFLLLSFFAFIWTTSKVWRN